MTSVAQNNTQRKLQKDSIEEALTEFGRRRATALVLHKGDLPVEEDEDDVMEDMSTKGDLQTGLGDVTASRRELAVTVTRLEGYRTQIWNTVAQIEACSDQAVRARKKEAYVRDCSRLMLTESLRRIKDDIRQRAEAVCRSGTIDSETRARITMRDRIAARLAKFDDDVRSKAADWSRLYDVLAERNRAVRAELAAVENMMLNLIDLIHKGDTLHDDVTGVLTDGGSENGQPIVRNHYLPRGPPPPSNTLAYLHPGMMPGPAPAEFELKRHGKPSSATPKDFPYRGVTGTTRPFTMPILPRNGMPNMNGNSPSNNGMAPNTFYFPSS